MLYENVESLCKAKSISIFALEKSLGFGNGTISKWRDGVVPRADKLLAVANALDTTAEELLR